MIKYLVYNYDGKVLTRTKIIKFCFLSDKICKEKTGYKMSNINYIIYHYGPYSDDIVDKIYQIDNVKENGIRTRFGECYKYTWEGNFPPDYSFDFEQQYKIILRDLLDNYKHKEDDELIELCYDKLDKDYDKYQKVL